MPTLLLGCLRFHPSPLSLSSSFVTKTHFLSLHATSIFLSASTMFPCVHERLSWPCPVRSDAVILQGQPAPFHTFPQRFGTYISGCVNGKLHSGEYCAPLNLSPPLSSGSLPFSLPPSLRLSLFFSLSRTRTIQRRYDMADVENIPRSCKSEHQSQDHGEDIRTPQPCVPLDSTGFRFTLFISNPYSGLG